MSAEILPVIYRDDWLVAVHKPAGLLVHRSEIDRHETRFALQIVRDQLGQKVWSSHRLDKPTSGLLLLGTFASASLGHFLLMWSSASLGAIGGFWLSWRLGIRYRHRLTHLRWLTAERLARSRLFFQRYGPWAIFFSRFLSPLRATLPFVSGASSLPLWSFQLANVSSGLLWPLLLLAPGAFSLSLW